MKHLINNHGPVILSFKDLPLQYQLSLIEHYAISNDIWPLNNKLLNWIKRNRPRYIKEVELYNQDIREEHKEALKRFNILLEQELTKHLKYYLNLFSEMQYGKVSIPIQEVIHELMVFDDNIKNWHLFTESYSKNIYVIEYESIWPVFLNDKTIIDGWKRFINYYNKKVKIVPCVFKS